MLRLGLDFPLRRLWFRKQHTKEEPRDIGGVTTTGFQDIGVFGGFDDFPLKILVSATINVHIQRKLKYRGDFFKVLGQEENPLGKEGHILPDVASDEGAVGRLAFDDVGSTRYERHEGRLKRYFSCFMREYLYRSAIDWKWRHAIPQSNVWESAGPSGN